MGAHGPRPGSRAALREVRDLMVARLGEPLSLEALAAEAGLSRYSFLRRFAAAYGMTPHAYLVHLRLERAKELLVRDTLPVTGVCLEVGFSSLGSFSTLFSRRTGESPLSFRRRAQRLTQVPDWVLNARVPMCFFAQVGVW